MHPHQDIPQLLTLYFGDSAAHAHRAASHRLKKWSRAFDQWTAGLRQDYRQDTLKHALLAWRRLVRQSGKMPWQLSPSDIDHHFAWLKQEGFAVSTINGSLGFIAAFYQWCTDQHVDSACPPGFNPAKAVSRTMLPRYAGVSMWSLEELSALLDLFHRDSSPLGKRDYAFFLARLNLGVPLKSLQRLVWGQVEQDGPSAWVSWRMDDQRLLLPDNIWLAVTDYLGISGRLEGMSAEKVIFAPQVQPVLPGSGGKAEDWLERQPLSSSALISSLKLYGRQLGIPEPKLTLMALRRTAIRLRIDQGESLEGMQIFMDTREKIKSTRYRLARLPGLAGVDPMAGGDQGMHPPLPVRQTTLLVGGEGTIHGFYARRKDMQAVRAVIAEDIHGIQQEADCLRSLMRGLLEREGDDAGLVEVYSQAAHRLGKLVSMDSSASQQKKGSWAEQVLSVLDKLQALNGRPPISQRIREDALGTPSDLTAASGRVAVEVATLRLMLRNLYDHAMLKISTREYIHLVDIYGLGCMRLSKLLKIEGGDGEGRLERYLRAGIDQAIRQVNQELRGGH
jgi:site-specific recombinase XerC